jgi:hypothetical protein
VFILKVVIYSATIAAFMFFGFWELRIKQQLTDEAPQLPESVVDRGVLDDLTERMKREQYLRSLPKQALVKYRRVVMLKFLFFAILFAEMIYFQMSK